MVLALAALAACGAPPQPVAIGSPLPEFELETRDGTIIGRAQLTGRPLVVAFWATWCQPCLKDLPELNALVTDHDIAVVAIALDAEGWTAVDPFLLDHPFEAAVVLGDEALFQRFGGFTIPYTLVADGAGTVQAVFRGTMERGEVLASLGVESVVPGVDAGRSQ